MRKSDELLAHPGPGPPGALDAFQHQLLPPGVLGSGCGMRGVTRAGVVLDDGLLRPGSLLLLGGVLMRHALLLSILTSRIR